MWAIPKDDCQSFFKVLTQISPADDTFGWKILVANQPKVSNSAYSSRAAQTKLAFWWCRRKFASEAEFDFEVAAGVWCTLYKSCSRENVDMPVRGPRLIFKTDNYAPGPSMTPVTSSMLSSFVMTRIPSGGFVLSSLSSFISRRNTAGITDFWGPMEYQHVMHIQLSVFRRPTMRIEQSGGREGGVEGGTRGMSAENVLGELEPSAPLGIDHVITSMYPPASASSNRLTTSCTFQ